MKILDLVLRILIPALVIAGFFLSWYGQSVLIIFIPLALVGGIWIVFIVLPEERKKHKIVVSKVTLILGILAFLSFPVVYFWHQQLDWFLVSNFGLNLWIAWLVYVSICLIGVVIDLVFRYIKKRRTAIQ